MIATVLTIIILFYINLNYLLFFFDIARWGRYSKKAKRLPKISVIIPTWDNENVIEETLKRLRKAYPRKKMELILVDYSKDNTRKIAKRYAKVVVAKKPGKAYALNLGVRNAKNDIMYFLDADSLVERDTIKRLVSAGDVVAGINLPVNKGGLVTRVGRMGAAFFNTLEIGIHGLLKTSLVPSKNIMVRRSIFKRVRGFSDSLTEDLNFSMKLYRIGQKINLIPAYCYELVPDKIRSYWKQQERWRLGTSDELKNSVNRLSLLERVVFLPYLIIRGTTPAVSIILLTLFFVFGDYLLLTGSLLGILILFIGCVRFLDKDDLIVFPFIFILYGIIDVLLLVNLLLKHNRKIAWYKTPKQGYGPSKPQSGQI